MAKDRLIVCKYYTCSNGECKHPDRNGECNFWKRMQTCMSYCQKHGAKPAKVETKRKKIEDARKRDIREY